MIIMALHGHEHHTFTLALIVLSSNHGPLGLLENWLKLPSRVSAFVI